jgi:hypothetical protein
MRIGQELLGTYQAFGSAGGLPSIETMAGLRGTHAMIMTPAPAGWPDHFNLAASGAPVVQESVPDRPFQPAPQHAQNRR